MRKKQRCRFGIIGGSLTGLIGGAATGGGLVNQLHALKEASDPVQIVLVALTSLVTAAGGALTAASLVYKE
jgi:hypothetical protein